MTQAANLAALGTNAGTTGILPAAGGGTAGTAGVTGFKNRIINGAMVIDQRNAGASVTAGSGYTLDRWNVDRVWSGSTVAIQQSSIAPVGFTNSLSATVSTGSVVASSSYFSIQQYIEGYNVADLNWGTANAKTFTVSFWVNSSVTGTYGVGFRNSAFNRSYWTTYTISSANTWTQVSVTIPGDTSGTWYTNNSYGINLIFSLGAGSTNTTSANNSWVASSYTGAIGETNLITTTGATFYITGVQLEVGTTATNFDVRSIMTELQLCQRYYEKSYPTTTAVPTNTTGPVNLTVGSNTYFGGSGANQQLLGVVNFTVTKRISPTVTIYSYASSTTSMVGTGWTGSDLAANTGLIGITTAYNFSIYNGTGGNVTTNGYSVCFHYAATAEL